MAQLEDIKDRTPNQSTIASIKRLLAQAESGELRSLFYVVGWDTDSVFMAGRWISVMAAG